MGPETTRAVGIDLGTTNSLLAVVENQKPRALRVDEGSPLLPSVVHYAPGGAVIVGRSAQRKAPLAPQDTISSVKRFMGRSADDAEVRRMSPYKFTSASGTVVRFEVAGREVTPVEVSAEVLRRLKREAERELGENVGGTVITVPAYFDDAQRQATRDAGKLAGLDVLRLLNEPTAAALAYGLDKRREGVFAVYDLGGGTFDISILKLEEGIFQVQSTGGDSQLGGDDMDRALAHLFFEEMKVGWESDPKLARRALDAARAVKEKLTTEFVAHARFEGVGGKQYQREITRQDLESLIAPILERTRGPVERALKDAQAARLDGVILVGGATRVPAVRAFVERLFGQTPLADIDPDQVVALGAAVQADLLAGTGPHDDVLLLDVIPLSLGLETMGGLVEKIIPRNATIPTSATTTFTTYADKQTGMDIHVVQGERELVADSRSLARFTLRGIPALPAGMGRVAVTFQVDADGILTVSAREQMTGVEQKITVKPSHGLTDEEVERMLLASFEHAEEDVRLRLLIDARVEAERVLYATQTGIAADGDLLTGDERTAIEGAVAALRVAMAGPDHRAVQEGSHALDAATHEFAGRRMDRAIQKALAGRNVDQVDQQGG